MESIPMRGSTNDHNHASSTPEPEAPSEFAALRKKFSQAVTQLETLLKASHAPLPTDTGDGSALPPPKESTVRMLGDVIRDLGLEGPQKLKDLVKVGMTAATHGQLNDRDNLMERLVQSAALLPADNFQTAITDQFLTQLWNDLQHPPQTLLADEYQFRQPDGSKNNPQNPQIGAANMAYARTVTPKTMMPGALPDPGILFDSVMARQDPEGVPHPNKISSMLFYLASIIIHDVFKTDHCNFNMSATSSYLDLAPLYGSTWPEQKRMRTFKDGKIKPDCFSEPRLLTFPAGVGALLIMFNRYHNYVVEQLAAINEGDRFTVNPRQINVERYGETINKRDDDLFQTGRLITCGLYVNIILIDYVRTILNLNRTDSNWQLNPRVDIPGGPALATGNQVSAEFNLVYRWHSAVSTKDDKWTQQLFREIMPDMTAAEAAEPQNLIPFLKVLAGKEAEFTAQDPPDRQFPALKEEKLDRIKEGPYAGNYQDDDLAKILVDGIEDCANAYGPQQVPTVMKAIEILGIQQARTWKVATLNEMRLHFGLQPYRKFEDITSNKEVSTALKHLYDTPDKVELYPGLVVEDAKRPMVPGSGLCPGYTISRGVLSDAVALVRGDRFYTTNYTPASLTNWGFTEASSDLTIDNGCVFYKLFLRALPNNFDPMSVYVHYPLTVPHGSDGMAEILQRLGKASNYTDLTTAPPSKGTPPPTVIFSHAACTKILSDKLHFPVTWGPAMEYLMGPSAHNFALAGDGPANEKSRKLMESALYQNVPNGSRAIPKGNEKWLTAVRSYYEKITVQLLQQKSYSLAGKKYVDLIRDVGNLAHVHFSSELFSMPLKTEKFPGGVLTEQQMYLVMAAVFICIFFDLDPAKSFPLRIQAKQATQTVGQLLKAIVGCVKEGKDVAVWIGERWDPIEPELAEYGLHMIKKLVEIDGDVDDLVYGNIMGTAGGMVTNQGQLFAQSMAWFLSDPLGQRYWPEVQKIARDETLGVLEQEEVLMGYLMEASRLAGETGVFRYANPTEGETIEVVDSPQTAAGAKPLGDKVYHLRKGDKLMINLRAASRDPLAFPNPDSFDPKRPLDSYVHLGHGPHQCLGLPMTRVALTTMLKVFARLEGLEAAPVAVGGQTVKSSLKKTVKEFVPGDLEVLPEEWHYHQFLTEDWEMYFPFPASKLKAFRPGWDLMLFD
ncbi:hypothetical protein LTR62_007927 [Meristemomyces frigidus]|uniref:Linoleate 8R-lipoxygenase n=1 Tax=Meristemomyces frigidus TaxID=1508187 RepID=A0AAN7TUT3_9PEZI|nr:hypothetical protein LTR62_007927 [Meristemomyces frigidus]